MAKHIKDYPAYLPYPAPHRLFQPSFSSSTHSISLCRSIRNNLHFFIFLSVPREPLGVARKTRKWQKTRDIFKRRSGCHSRAWCRRDYLRICPSLFHFFSYNDLSIIHLSFSPSFICYFIVVLVYGLLTILLSWGLSSYMTSPLFF